MNYRLPRELMLNVLSFVIWAPRLGSGPLSAPVKRQFPSGFSQVSKYYREMLLSEWFYLLVLHSPDDLKHPQYAQIFIHVRALTLKEGSLVPRSFIKTLDSPEFQRVHTITLDCHNDVGCTSSGNCKGGQWSYKKIMPRLPRNLKALIVLNAHGPDLQVIQQAVDQCPDLEHLCLGRCTKFNRPNNCGFWEKFPDDHDSYFSIKGVEGYAKALGTELKRLKRLKSIYVNVYLTDTKYLFPESSTPGSVSPPTPQNRVLEASSSERTPAQSPAPNNRALDAPNQSASSTSQDQDDTKAAEKSAVWTLFECHNALQYAAFISYWSPGHLWWSCHTRNSEQTTQIPYNSSQLTPPDTGGQSPPPDNPGANLKRRE
ncbi:hypothetical protein FRC10_005857 [Ceratobasidium sp. 414]|nr:hypothetical protein FRC10_005857 [Ceratobasidium sp. 414]